MTSPPEPIPGARLLFGIDPGVTYLNHGAFGAVPLPVQRAQRRLRDEMESNPQRFFTAGLLERIGHARHHLATFLGADPDSAAFVPNATAGANAALRTIRPGPGDEVVTTAHGYGAVDIAVDHVCTRSGATHVTVPMGLADTDDDIVAAVAAALDRGRARLLIVDQVASATARVLPVERLVAAARDRDVPVLVDGAHAPGAHDLPVAAIGADFWVGNLHKWMYAPRPTAILSVAPRFRDRVEPAVISWEDAAGYPANLEMGGTLDYTAWLAAPAGLFVMRALGVDRVRAHNAELAVYGQRVVAAALGVTDLPDPGSPGACMRLVPLPEGTVTTQVDARALSTRIADQLNVVVPISYWQGQGLLRLCAQVYNQADDYERLAEGLPKLLASLP